MKKKAIIIVIVVITLLIGVVLATVNAVRRYDIAQCSKELQEAIREKNFDKVQQIVKECPECVNSLSTALPFWYSVLNDYPDSYYPLQTACSCGNYDVAKLLLENGADPNLVWKGIESSTPAIVRAVKGKSTPIETKRELVKLLLEYGADKDKGNLKYKTALYHAQQIGDPELIELLS